MSDPFAHKDTPVLSGNVLNGQAVAARMRVDIAAGVSELKEKHGKVPGLAVVIVGERKDSQTYVRMKKRACEEVGIASFEASLPESATQAQVLATVAAFNADPQVHGILVQLPLPRHIDEQAVLGAISLAKDVDGFHPLNMGRLTMKGREPLFAPCTPLGCIALLDAAGVALKGKRAVVVGRSNIVGMPVALLLNKRDATVTICHSATKDMEAVVREADVVIAACGQPGLIKGSWLKPGAAVIDVGTNPLPDPSKKAGFRLVGDVEWESAKDVAGVITPVPGGVGPMTITMLLHNTLASGKRAIAGEALPAGAADLVDAARGKQQSSRGGDSPAVIALGALVVGALLREGVRLVGRAAGRK